MAILASVWWGGGELEIEDSLEGVLTPIEQGCSAFGKARFIVEALVDLID